MKHVLRETRVSAPRAPAGGPTGHGGSGADGVALVAWTQLMTSGLAWYQAWFGLWCSAAEAGLHGSLAPRGPRAYARTVRSVMTPPPKLEATVIPFAPRARGGTST